MEMGHPHPYLLTTMSDSEKSSKRTDVTTIVTASALVERRSPNGSLLSVRHADDALLAELGYKAEFKREFSVSQLRTASVCIHSRAPHFLLG